MFNMSSEVIYLLISLSRVSFLTDTPHVVVGGSIFFLYFYKGVTCSHLKIKTIIYNDKS